MSDLPTANTPGLVDGFGTITLTPHQIHAARLYICANAHDTDDAALLLDALGIGGGE